MKPDIDLLAQLENRIAELEMKLSFQDDALQALNDVIAKQDREIQNLWSANRLIKQSMDDLKSDQDGIAEPPPPHY